MFTIMETSQKKFCPPISKGIVTTFDAFIGDIKRIIILSVHKRFDPEENADVQKALERFSNITDNSQEDDCLQFIESLKNVETTEYESITCFEKETAITDFYNYFCKFRNLVEQKLSLPLLKWKLVKKDSETFLDTFGKLSKEVDHLRSKIEEIKLMRNKVISYQENEEEIELQKNSAAEDFISLHPHFLMKNSEEHMEKISALEEKKIDSLQEQLRSSERNFKSATLRFKKEIETVIAETLKTKSFIEWLEEKNHFKLKDYEMRIKTEWNGLIAELGQARELDRTYIKKHAHCLEIRRERAEKDRLHKLVAAATTVQIRWRAYAARKQLEKKMGIA